MKLISPTHYQCPDAPPLVTHHLAPAGPAAAQYMKCRTCGKTERELRAAIMLDATLEPIGPTDPLDGPRP